MLLIFGYWFDNNFGEMDSLLTIGAVGLFGYFLITNILPKINLKQEQRVSASNIPGSYSGLSAFTFNVVGDISQNSQTAQNLASGSPNIILIAGDFGYQQNPKQWWTQVMKPINGKDAIAALGNHDSASEYLSIGAFRQTSWSFNRRLNRMNYDYYNYNPYLMTR